ncbi:MAG: DUF2809 domain-containing protein [Actinomycetota bacterium]
MRRRRIAVALAVVLVAGVASRRVDSLPGFVIDHAGDALWTTAVVLAIAFVFRTDARASALAGYGISVVVELSQLWKPGWLDDLRDNDLVALAIGRGWVWSDLVRYAVGALIGFWLVHVASAGSPEGVCHRSGTCRAPRAGRLR